MKVSALIPTYNSAATIRGTLDSVLAQTEPADEVLVLDDGSTDDTVSILESYRPRITVIQQRNGGVAQARNVLCARATGELLAFLDHDDFWHPDYLKIQRQLFAAHPGAVAFFTGHATLYGAGNYTQWEAPGQGPAIQAEEIAPVAFIKRYHQAIGAFMSMSFCCVPKAAIQRLGERPFCSEVSGVDDCYLFHQLPFFGPIVYYPALLAAYRITTTAQSADRVKGAGLSVRAMELLGADYRGAKDAGMRATYRWALATQRREYGKVLMCAGRVAAARRQFLLAAGDFWQPASVVKSFGLLLFSCMPRSLQPQWLPIQTAAPGASAV